MAVETAHVDADPSKVTKKKNKKDKKDKKNKNVAAEVDPEQTAPQEDSSTNTEVKSLKKKKRKHAEVEVEVEEEKMDVDGDAPPEESEKKKKKKRKHASETEGEVTPEQISSQESAVDSKKEKKEKKEKKKEKRKGKEAAGQTSSSSSNSSQTPSPSEVAAFLTKNEITIHVPPSSSPVTPFISFAQLPIPESLRSFSSGFKEPSPIQACTWPPALEGRDVVGIAETGSGKTLAFGIPALSRLIKTPPPPPSRSSPTITTLIVAPTRELALQTHETLSSLGEQFGIASVAVFGGVSKEGQVNMLKNLHKGKNNTITRIIVGTPGRILDLMSEGACDLSGVDFLVLDEADRMLDKGFENDIRKIISQTKPQGQRQTVMFSATWPEAVRRLAGTFQKDPVRVTVGSDDLTANSRVEQVVEVLDNSQGKDSRLLHHLRTLGHKKRGPDTDARILVFALYKVEASRVESMLRREGYSVGALHGDLSQSARLQALDEFKAGKTGLLVATDVAARGLDIPNVGAVINYTFPLTIEDYIHRIGRTGRGGKSGKSITFFTGENQERGLAGELSRVLNDSGFECPDLKKFPMTIKKKEHGAYGAFFRDDIPAPTRKKIVFS